MPLCRAHRILMLLENNSYASDRRVVQEAETLSQAGYQVTVICPMDGAEPWHERVNGVGVYRFPAPPEARGLWGYLCEYGYAMVIMFLISLLVFVRHGFDIVHTHNPPDTLVLIAAFYKLLGKQFVFDHHDLMPEMYMVRLDTGGHGWVYRALVGFERLSHRLADHVIATNESYKTIAMNRGHVPAERITIVRNGPDRRHMRQVEPEASLQAIRDQGKIVIAYVGEMEPHDGVDYLLRALRHLRYDLGRTNFHGVLIGHGAAYAGLQILATDCDLNDRLTFTGWVPYADVASYLSATDICTAPEPSNVYNDRSTMIKLMEYMALGKPIVSFGLPQHQYTARDASLYAQANDELDFARMLAALMDDPLRRQQMGQRGLERIDTELSWSYQAQQLLKAYDVLTTGKASPQSEAVADHAGLGEFQSRKR